MEYRTESKVEEYFEGLGSLCVENRQSCRIRTLVTENYVMLGQLTALRFIEWASLNPGGVVSLTAGKTPEFFIRWLEYYRYNWDRECKDGLVGKLGLKKPDYHSLHFFQMDEFFPIKPEHERSFRYFVKKYYIDMLGFDPAKTNYLNAWSLDGNEQRIAGVKNLGEAFMGGSVDLSVLSRTARSRQEEVQQKVLRLFKEKCVHYENKIRDLGGIGFFISGIGPDGHIALNVRGSGPDSRTRLLELNYESQAAAAQDLGGITAVRRKAAMTVGLETITFNPDCVAIIIAAGHLKAKAVAGSVLNEPTRQFPATYLQSLPNSRFFITRASAVELPAIKDNLPVVTADEVKVKVKKGLQLPDEAIILHTSPHHDDVELAYVPYLQQLVHSKGIHNHFTYCTSGYTSVTDDYLLSVYRDLFRMIDLEDISSQHYDAPRRLALNWMAERGVNSQSELRRFVEDEIRRLVAHETGRPEPDSFLLAKGWLRESEAAMGLARFGIEADQVHHLRLPFYSDDIFPHYPDPDKDVKPIVRLLESIRPTIVTLALDPEGGGPDTHFKTLIAVSAALEQFHNAHPEIDLHVWGYRNVWSQWRMDEVNTMIPVSPDGSALIQDLFDTCYLSQRDAEFPSYEYEGPFSELAQRVWAKQYSDVSRVLGEDFFHDSDDPMLKNTCGMIYLKDMDYNAFRKYMVPVKRFLEMKTTMRVPSSSQSQIENS